MLNMQFWNSRRIRKGKQELKRKAVLGIMLTLLLIGMLSLTFDIQRVEASGTIYIKADGSIEGTTDISSADNVTYTFSDNIYDSIVIERDNIVIDGAGHTLQGSGAYESKGIFLFERSNVTIKNSEITMFESGICLHRSSNITISGNNITNNEYDGIYLEYSSNSRIAGNNIIDSYSGIKLVYSSNNTISGNNVIQYKIWFGMMRGISLYGSSGNNIYGNNITNHCDDGIHLEGSRNSIIANNITNNGGGIWLQGSSNILGNNSMTNNERNFQVFGSWPDGFVNDVDTSNTVDGKPVYYWINRRDIAVPLDAGYVALLNCANITAKNLNLTNNGQGILLVETTNSTITKNNMINNWYGIDLLWSNYNSVVENNITNNGYGIRLHASSRNSISRNNITNNEDSGILLYESSNNLVQQNMVINNVYLQYSRGIEVGGSSNIISGNIVNGSKYNFDVSGDLPSHSIDSSNLVDGKPVYYLVNIKNKVINPSTHPQVGYIALIECINITIEGLTLANNQQGLLISNTNNSKIVGNNITNNCYGVLLEYSSNTLISGNNITNNCYGVLLEYSSNTLISGNNITNNEGGGGIDLDGSSNNSVTGNSMAKNRHGIYLGKSSNNNISRNNITENNEYGIGLYESSNNTIYGNNITGSPWPAGIWLTYCSNNSIIGNNITASWAGIWLGSCSNNSVSGNSITANNLYGVWLEYSSNNTICGNDITNNGEGVYLEYSSNNIIYHNNFVNNTQQVYMGGPGYANIWDDGYPSGGNYWSNYQGTDYYSGPHQNVTGSDGIGDTSYVIDGNNQDNYPLMQPYHGPVRNLNTGESYPTIQGAINNATEGDRIFALSGTYYEHVVVNKTVSLIGENKYNTIVDGNNTGTVMNVTAGNVNINGFTIRNSGEWPNSGIRLDSVNTCYMSNLNVANHSLCGIRLYSSNKNTLTSSTITNSQYGIQLTYSEDNIVTHNTVTNNSLCGILLEDSNNNTLTDNIITNNLDGILLGYSSNNNTVTNNNVTNQREHGIRLYESSNNNELKDNTITNNNEGGIWLYSSNNNTMTHNIVTNNYGGIRLDHSSNNNTLTDNTITNNTGYGILLDDCDNNRLTDNIVTNHILCGILLDYSSIKNTVKSNTVANNSQYGIVLDHQSNNNTIHHNNFINNTNHAYTYGSINTWDDGYPSGGNYWSDYTGVDANMDGIGDSSYEIDSMNIDHCPLMGMFSDFSATSEYHVQTICNSSISDFQFNGTAICFNVTGESGTTGFCRICIPRALMNETYKVFVNGTEVPYTLLPCSNNTHSYLYFTYSHSTEEVIVVPEFPTWTSMLLILVLLTVAIAIYKQRLETASR
jgi:parallel beta-helix repeat protein